MNVASLFYMSDDSDRRARGSVPTEVHRVLVEELDSTGSIPPAHVIADITGIGVTAVRRALRSLHDDGLLAQPHGPRAPYIPLFRPDGTRVRPVLVEVGKEPSAQEEPKSTAELLEELSKRLLELENR